MPSKFRLSIVLIAIVAVLGAGWYAFERNAAQHSAIHRVMLALNGDSIATDVSDAGPGTSAGSESQDLAILDYSLEKVQDVYYKPVDVAVLVRGEQKGIDAYLTSKKVAPPPSQPVGSAPDEDTANSVLRSAIDTYGAKLGDDDLTFAAVSGMLDSLGDPYTVFLDPSDKRRLNELITGGNFGGIGVYIGQDDKSKSTVIIEPISGTPADRAGLKPGDIIVSVDGHPTKGLKLDPVMNLIRGAAGTTAHLEIKRGDLLKAVEVVREEIHVPSVASRMVDGDVGYIQLFDFGDTSADEMNSALESLTKQGAKAFILDLRDNGGGLLSAAVDVSSKFIADGPIVSIIDRSGRIETHDANGDAIMPKPLVVLVNQFTASASEITAGAIQDDRVGTLIGVKTYGKGVVQTIYDLPGASAIKITTARYVTPAGRDINKKGIWPNVVVPMNPANIGIPARDVQLHTALTTIQRQLALAH